MTCEPPSEAIEWRESDNTVPEKVKLKWEKQQIELKQKLSLEDADVIKKLLSHWDTDKYAANDLDTEKSALNEGREFYIAGVDLSFVKNDNINACAAIVIVRFPDLQLVYEDCQMVKLTAPYIPGYLAFRECPFILERLHHLKEKQPSYYPQLLMVDGNGILHPREFGLACQLGVLSDIPSIGVAKKLFQVDGLVKDDRHHAKIEKLKKGGDTFPLQGSSGKVLGVALRSCDSTKNPIYVSPGHRISLESAMKLVHGCCQHRVPEPIRWADIKSREYIRAHFTMEDQENQRKPKRQKSHRKKNGREEHEKILKLKMIEKNKWNCDVIFMDGLDLFVTQLLCRFIVFICRFKLAQNH